MPKTTTKSNRKPALGQRSTLIKHVTSMSYKLEPVIWSRDTGQQITWFDRCQLIIAWCHISKKYTVNQGCMSLPTYYLEYSGHLARLHCRRRVYAPTSNTGSHDNHDKINSWVSFCFLHGYRAPLLSFVSAKWKRICLNFQWRLSSVWLLFKIVESWYILTFCKKINLLCCLGLLFLHSFWLFTMQFSEKLSR